MKDELQLRDLPVGMFEVRILYIRLPNSINHYSIPSATVRKKKNGLQI